MNLLWTLLIVILLNPSDSRKLCSRKLALCKDSVCKCPSGYKANKNATCCVPICENKCIGGKCVGINKCRCLRGYTATKIANVCEPFCSNCTNGYCYGYEQCAARKNTTATPELKCGVATFSTTGFASSEIRTSTVGVEARTTEDRNLKFDQTTEEPWSTDEDFPWELKGIDEFEETYLPKEKRRKFNSSPSSESKINTKKPTTIIEEHISTKTSEVSPSLNDELVFDGPEGGIIENSYHGSDYEVEKVRTSPEGEKLSPEAESNTKKPTTITEESMTKNSETNVEVVFDGPEVGKLENSFYNSDPEAKKSKTTSKEEKISPEPEIITKKPTTITEEHISTKNSAEIVFDGQDDGKLENSFYSSDSEVEKVRTSSEEENPSTSSGPVMYRLTREYQIPQVTQDAHKDFPEEFRTAAVPLGIGILLGCVLLGFFISYQKRNQQTYHILQE